eukprot:ctg_1471.g498
MVSTTSLLPAGSLVEVREPGNLSLPLAASRLRDRLLCEPIGGAPGDPAAMSSSPSSPRNRVTPDNAPRESTPLLALGTRRDARSTSELSRRWGEFAGLTLALSVVMILLAAFVERQQAVGRERALESLRQSVWALVNTSARPCGGDFYAFACGNYREAVPPGESVWERGMSQVRYSAVPLLRALLENELREYRAGLFYRSCVDADALRPDDRQPLDALIAAVQRAASWEALARVLAAVHRSGYGSVIYSFAVVRNVWRSDDSATAYVLAFQQGGLGLAPSYWVGCGGSANDNDNSTCGRVLQDYRTYVQQLSRSAWPYGNHGGGGDDDDDDDHIDADAVAAAVLALEEQLAHLYWESALPYASRADVEAATAHDTQAVPLAQLDSRYPHLHLGAYTEQLLGGYNAQRLLSWVAVRAPTLFAGLDALVATTDLQHWKWYVLYQVVSSSAGMGALGAAFTDLHFAFYGRQLAGRRTGRRLRQQVPAGAGAGHCRTGGAGGGRGLSDRHRERPVAVATPRRRGRRWRGPHHLGWRTGQTRAAAAASRLSAGVGYGARGARRRRSRLRRRSLGAPHRVPLQLDGAVAAERTAGAGQHRCDAFRPRRLADIAGHAPGVLLGGGQYADGAGDAAASAAVRRQSARRGPVRPGGFAGRPRDRSRVRPPGTHVHRQRQSVRVDDRCGRVAVRHRRALRRRHRAVGGGCRPERCLPRRAAAAPAADRRRATSLLPGVRANVLHAVRATGVACRPSTERLATGRRCARTHGNGSTAARMDAALSVCGRR